MKTKDTPKQYVIYSRKSKFTGKGYLFTPILSARRWSPPAF